MATIVTEPCGTTTIQETMAPSVIGLKNIFYYVFVLVIPIAFLDAAEPKTEILPAAAAASSL